jgi:hypothetical protein
MRLVMRVGGGIAIFLGGVWMLQGIGFLPGSFMTGQMTWFWNGMAVAAVGVVGVLLGSRRRAP